LYSGGEGREKMRKKLWLPVLVLAVLLTALPFPFETTIVPQWRIQVVDKAGTPLLGVTVTEHWSHSSLEHDGHEAEATTDEGGYVTFPVRTIRASLLGRAIGPVRNVLKTGVHAGFGPSADLSVPGDIAVYSWGKPLPKQIVFGRVL
jgi:hypothetical protein